MNIHQLADVQSKNIGKNTTVWQFSVVLKGAVIGENCNINCHVFIENDVTIGNNVTVKSGVYLWDGIRISDNVFIGPNVTFTNDKYPRSKQYPDQFSKTFVNKGASIGAGSIISGGITIGSFALVGAGSIVTKDVPERALVFGQPATIQAWLNDDGTKMKKLTDDNFMDNYGTVWILNNSKLTKK